MKIDKRQLADKFTEIVAIRLDRYAQREEGIWPPDTNTDRWHERYRGTPFDKLPPYTVELNRFKHEVDYFVADLMRVVGESSL